MKQHHSMPTYYLNTEPDAKGNFRLHVEKCPFIQNSKSVSFLGKFENLEKMLLECKSSDYKISLCRDCIDINYAKPLSERKSLVLSLLKWFRSKK